MTLHGALVTYLGTAPGVGKTYAMLGAGRRRAESGELLVVGWIERHGRAETRAQLGDLAIVTPLEVSYRGSTFLELDVNAVIVSGADVVLVDELAHTRPDGSRKRWEDVADIRAAGIDVLTTTNVANLRSVRDYAARVTGRARWSAFRTSSSDPEKSCSSMRRRKSCDDGSCPAGCTKPSRSEARRALLQDRQPRGAPRTGPRVDGRQRERRR